MLIQCCKQLTKSATIQSDTDFKLIFPFTSNVMISQTNSMQLVFDGDMNFNHSIQDSGNFHFPID
jgi:hypothetical protein